MSINNDVSGQVIEKLIAYAQSQLPADVAPAFSEFTRIYYSQMPVPDLVSRSIPDLYGNTFSHWNLMQQRQKGELKIKIFNPTFEEYGWQSTHTIIQVTTDDMPFLVDSMRMEINRLYYTIHLMIYSGGLKAKRDKSGKLLNVYPYYSSECSDCLFEAPIQMEIDRQTDPEVLRHIEENLVRVLRDVRTAVEDWQPMRHRLEESISEIDITVTNPREPEEVKESKAYLEWLLNDHFTFLGARDYEVIGEGAEKALRLIPNSGLGVLRDEAKSKMLRQYSELPKPARDLALSKEQIVIISKTNTISTVHRPVYTDYVGVKRFNAEGEVIGERRFIGLYTSTAYRTDPRCIPLIRQKVAYILQKSNLPPQSHAGKDLLYIISTLPRDDLFHANINELFPMCIGILQIQERRCTRLFIREDSYGRFLSCLVYLPRENLTTDHAMRIMDLFQKTFKALDISQNIMVSESVLARIHYVVRVNPRKKLVYDVEELEQKIQTLIESWQDALHQHILEYFGEERGNALFAKYRTSFPAGYREVFNPRVAIFDIEHIEQLQADNRLGMSFYRPAGASPDVIKFKSYRRHQTLPLSDAVPMLENMGLRVIDEQPYQIHFQDGTQVWINDFTMTYSKEPTFEVNEVKDIFQEAFQRIWSGDAENDGFNRLVLEAQLTWREIAILRAYTKYFRQMGVTFSEQYISSTLINNHHIAKLLVELFKYRFDPKSDRDPENENNLIKQIEKELEKVLILDDDRIIRRYLTLIRATLRTNYYQFDKQGEPKPYLSFKLNPHNIPELPLPLPMIEIFVYSPRFEGVHLRADKIARGGIRWSDRREDFRTEVLGLMKAQNVKNALIVPAGAKGGFVTKVLPTDLRREAILQEGIACYENFIRGLLDVTDNIVEGTVLIDANTVHYDDEDPYIVVAADKGTATFSDIANRIAEERNFWLQDAFASGGSTGYDHKKMAITARGAWVSAERHFQNLGINVDSSEITVVAIGDMSGDVFGNGMLMSRHLRLIAAFNHIHIFLDPNPDPEASYHERKRLFDMPRSTWEDYDKALISAGGGVHSRFAKAIPISAEVQKILNITDTQLEPNELIKAILKAPVDLIWNGGIGTYVKASTESNESVGDRSNDGLRVNGKDLNARVVVEGGNLGLTQLGRVEYELSGGRVNTDFIDNSGGVDCSDHEVNIKILLNAVLVAGDMTYKQRNELLAKMSDEVAELVLQDNYQQNRVISLNSYFSASSLGLFVNYIQAQEKLGNINRKLEFLPEDKVILERRNLGRGLTRPELSILLAYSKNILKDEILKTDLVNDPYLSNMVEQAFPMQLRQHYREMMKSHYLAKDIIATQISNILVSDMGITFVFQMQNEMGASIASIVRAYAAAREIFALETFYAEIEALDYQVDAELQYLMMAEGIRVVRRAVRWFLRNRREGIDIQASIDEFSPHVISIYLRLPKLILGANKERFNQHVSALVEKNVPQDVAVKVASAARIYHALNIIEAANFHHSVVFRVAKIYFMLVDRLDLLWFRDQINAFPVTDRWSILAKAAYKGDLDWVQRALTIGVLSGKAKSIPGKVNYWLEAHRDAIERWKSIIADMRSADTIEFAILFVAIRELLDLAEIQE